MSQRSQAWTRRLRDARRRFSVVGGALERGPSTAVIAVTLNCNAKCVMCDIWKNRMKDELSPDEFSALPPGLRDINISGGEPFLRKDLPEVVAVIRKRCPHARLVISTNGFLPARIEESLREIYRHDPMIGVRVSLDGIGEEHDRIRGIPGGFDKATSVLDRAAAIGITDLGIGVTLMDGNRDQLKPLVSWARQRELEFSVTVVTDSPIFFGEDKSVDRGEAHGLAQSLNWLASRDSRSQSPKRWIRGWYEGRLAEYVISGKRPLSCDAGSGFFYLDSMGNVYACHVRDLKMGNLRTESFDSLWHGAAADEARSEAAGCDGCFLLCTSKSQIARHLPRVVAEAGRDKLRAHLG